MSFSADDARFMARAIQLARRGLYTADPNPRVGCVIARDGKMLGEGWHERAGLPHAEIEALSAAGAAARGATAYVTLEPCCHHGRTPPCTDALIRAGIKRVVAAMLDPNPRVAGQGLAALEQAGVAVGVGLLEADADALNPGFLSRMRAARPFVRLKLAASMDGRTALVSGESKWITGEAARRDVQRWRARSAAILTGVETVLADDPSLTVRELEIGRQPLRVVVDTRLRMPGNARMLRLPGTTLLATASTDMARARALHQAGAEIVVIPADGGRVNLASLMQTLAAREVNEILVEAGATLCGSLVDAGLVDEVLLYYAPHLMGATERGMFAVAPLAAMNERTKLQVVDVRAVGEDWRVTARLMPVE
jgi:diaminohydroxyphosphoribosylaminopyrimidine deaminase/5-amino-6-(5-phosphoribosylamino)uracil reductase